MVIQRLFVYGTLAPGRANEHLLKEIGGTWEDATVTGILYPDGWGAALGYPAIVLDENAEEVEGFIFISDKLSSHWEKLDKFEGGAYERVLVVAKLKDKSTVEAYIYQLRGK